MALGIRTWFASCTALALVACGGDVTSGDAPPPDDGAGTVEVEACPIFDDTLPETQLHSHRVQRSTSTDGVTFSNDDAVLLEHASVPDAVVLPDGRTWLYYVNGNAGQHGVFIAELDESTGKFEPFDCLRLDAAFDGNAVDPDIVLLPDGRFRLFYYKGWFVDPVPPDNPPHPFYSAISDDGIHFEVEGKLIETEGGGTDPTAVQMPDDSWLMALTVGDHGILTRSADDGTTFEPTGYEFGQGIPEIARFDDGTLRLYVAGMSMSVLRSDDDGATWAEEGTSTVGGADPSLVQAPDGSYVLYRKSFDAPAP